MKTFCSLVCVIIVLMTFANVAISATQQQQKEQQQHNNIFRQLSPSNTTTNWQPPIYNESVWMSCRSKFLLNPSPTYPMSTNWYDMNLNTTWPSSICTVVFPNITHDATKYFLKNFSSVAAAQAANESGNIFQTHSHPCGLCSNLNDLSVYMQYPDLTSRGKFCGAEGFLSFNDSVKCFQKIGFTQQCSQIWARDAQNTRKDCEGICLKALIEHWPNNMPPNSTTLNPCLECDEVKSGPVFKLVAGRTRRDSGLHSSINRPADQVSHLTHFYCLK